MLGAMRRWTAGKIDPDRGRREKALAYRISVLRGTLEQVAWRQAMDLRSVDQRAANRLIHMGLAEDVERARQASVV